MVEAQYEMLTVKDSPLLQRLTTLHEITSHIDAAPDRDAIIKVVRTEAARVLDYKICFASMSGSNSYLVIVLSPGIEERVLDGMHFRIGEGSPGWVIENGMSVIKEIERGRDSGVDIDSRIQALGVKSLMSVPMWAGSSIVGALTFGSVEPEFYTEEDARVAQLLALSLGTALNNVMNLEIDRKRINQIELINQISGKLSSMLRLEELLSSAADAIRQAFNYFDVTVFLLTDDRKELVLKAHAGSFHDFLPQGYRQLVDSGIMGWVASHSEKLLCNDISQDSRYYSYEYRDTKSELAVPIKIDNDVVGVLNVEDTRVHAFDETDAMVLETLCDQLGSAIRNAKLYEELYQANTKLTQLDKMKSEFLGIVSHDFRSPLSSIMLASKSLLRNEAIQKIQRAREYLQLIVDQANRLNQLAEDTLSITKLESGQLSYVFKIVNVERLIQDAVSMVRFSSKHHFEFKVDPEVLFINGDQTKLRQTIQNLVSNAVKYSPQGGMIKVVCENISPDEVLISISDEGIGIPSDKLDRLFQKFSRVDSTDAREIKGAGLGLWICREIVQSHGGKIWVESEPGKGSIFKLTLKKTQEESA